MRAVPRSTMSLLRSDCPPHPSRWCCVACPARARKRAVGCWRQRRAWGTAPTGPRACSLAGVGTCSACCSTSAAAITRNWSTTSRPRPTSRGYDLVLSTVTRTHDEQRAIETLVDFRCEAVLLLGPESPVSRLAMLGRQLPVIVIGRRTTAAGVDVVRSADDDGVRQAVDHLVALGHRAIAYVDGGRSQMSTDRRRGLRRGHASARAHRPLRVLPGDSTQSAGGLAATTLLHEGLPTAVITYNDRSAIGLLDGLARSGIEVPATVSVVGYDDSPEAQLAVVDLTTVSQDAAPRRSTPWRPPSNVSTAAARHGVRSSSARTWCPRHHDCASVRGDQPR